MLGGLDRKTPAPCLQIFSLDFASTSTDLPLAGAAVTVPERFSRLCWGPPGLDAKLYPVGGEKQWLVTRQAGTSTPHPHPPPRLRPEARSAVGRRSGTGGTCHARYCYAPVFCAPAVWAAGRRPGGRFHLHMEPRAHHRPQRGGGRQGGAAVPAAEAPGRGAYGARPSLVLFDRAAASFLRRGIAWLVELRSKCWAACERHCY